MYRDKINKKSNIASIVELFMMFLLLLVVIVVITMVSMTARQQSLDAGNLTDAVICAENTAEVTKYTTDVQAAAEMIGKMDGVTDVQVEGDTVTASQEDFRIEVSLSPESDSAGTYVDENIRIFSGGETAIYELHTGSFISKDKEGEQ